MAAAAYCESRGGLLPVDAEPASWGADEPFIEWRLGANGTPAWRNSVGDKSGKVTPRQSNPDAAFRCGRP